MFTSEVQVLRVWICCKVLCLPLESDDMRPASTCGRLSVMYTTAEEVCRLCQTLTLATIACALKFRCMYFSFRNPFLQRRFASLTKDIMGAHLHIFFVLELAASDTDSGTSVAGDKAYQYHDLACVTPPFLTSVQ